MILLSSLSLTCISAFLLYKSFPLNNRGPAWENALLQIVIWLGFVLGLHSIVFFLWMLIIGPAQENFIFFEVFFSAMLCFIFLRKKTKCASTEKEMPSKTGEFRHLSLGNRTYILLIAVFLLLLLLSISDFFKNSINAPHGQWDAWAIWNLRARFLAEIGTSWREIFANTPWSHTDYPLLLPNTIARYWIYAKDQSVLVPILTAFFFGLATVLAVFSSVSILKGKMMGAVSGIAILGTQLFSFAASQYADIPLSFFILTSLILVTLHFSDKTYSKYLVILLGFYSALAAWTKNEGLLFATLFILLYCIFSFVSKKNVGLMLKKISLLMLGAVMILSALLFMKFELAPRSDLAPKEITALTEKITDTQRYTIIKKELGKNARKIIPLPVILLLLLSLLKTRNLGIIKTALGLILVYQCINYPYLLTLVALVLLSTGILPKTDTHRAALFSYSIITLMLLGYLFIYLITPNDLKWHIRTSMDRLLIQLVPAIIFAISLTFTAKSTGSGSIQTTRPKIFPGLSKLSKGMLNHFMKLEKKLIPPKTL